MKKRNTLVKKIAAALLASLFYTDTILLAASPILPDTKAPSDRQPLVQETANGIPLVNIAAPSAGGVSRNDYERFNVPEKGAILNNSYTLSKTELAGFVQGNANMAGGPAKIILNQVTSGHPTTMNGFLEVAGTKADVVIANPNGITVNGGGFINTGRAILTTGKPEYSLDNQWKDIRVSNDAMIVIDGKGLNGEKADVIEVYTRAAKILGQIKAETLQVTTGANVIDAKSGTATAIEGSGVKPQVAIDAADLGAMNAGRIFFVLNEENIPAKLQSAIEAQDLVIDSKGNLYHTGIIHTKDGATIRAKDILNKGTIASGGHLSVTSEGTLTNAKIIGAEGHAEIHAGDVVNQSVIASEGHLAISSDRTITNENSRILANGDVTLDAKEMLNNRHGTMASGGNLDVKTAELNNEQGNVTAYGNGLLSSARKLDNAEGHVAANAEWDAQYKGILETLNTKIRAYNEEAEKENNSHGTIGSYKIKYYTIIRTTTHTSEKQVQETRAGQVASGKHMTLTGNVINENSRITAGASLSATGGSLENKAEQNQLQSVTFGTMQESYTKRKPRPHKAWRRHYRGQVFMPPQKEMGNPTSLGVGSYAGHTASAPQSQDITQSIRDNIQNFLYPFHAESSTKPGTTAGKETGGSLSFLPESALYQLHPETTAKYLVETDPAFTNKKKFLSSDYMYQQMTWDPERVTKRLGDGFYEQELLRNQIIQLTGKTYLDGFTNNEDEFHTLMDSGIAYAKEFHLTPGIALTKEQMAALTSDIVWLETTTVTVNGKTYDVLYPHVYLKAGSEKKIAADGSLISANQLVMEAKNQLANSGVLMGNSILMQGKNIVNRGMIYGDTVQLKASHDIKESGIIHAENQVSLTADNNITMQDTVLHAKNQDVLHTTAGIAVKGKDGVLLMEAGKDIHLTGATLEALGDNGSLILKAGNNIHLDTDTLEAKKDMTENSDNYIRTYRKTETTNTLAAGKTITLAAGENLSARNTTVLSENGQITVAAKGDVNLENGYNESRDDYGLKYKERGLLSSKTTTIKSHDESKTVTASTLSGEAVQITAGGNTNVIGSNVVGTHDVAISSGKDTSISSAEEYEQHDYAKQVKKSGLLSSGLGFTIGTEKRKDQYRDADVLQKASTVGSVSGNASIESGNKVVIGASAVLAGKDISITGENVQISSKDNVYHSEEKHEYKKSGLTVSATGGAVAVLSDALAYAQKASSARDKQLKALYGAEVYQTIAKGKDVLKDLSGKGMPGVSVEIGTSSFKAENHTKSTEAMASALIANENVKVQTKSDISMKGSQASGHTISFHAGGSIMLDAAEDRSTTDTVQSSKSSQMGMNFMPTGNSVFAENSKGNGTEAEIITTHTGSQLTAEEKISLESGKDTALRGSRVSAGQVTVQAGGNLSIESLQDTDTYRSQSHSTGSSFSTGTSRATAHHGKWMTGKSEENTDSHYASVTEQAGIHAGANGYDITVKGNTNLTGGLIDSTAAKEKNSLTTGTLSWADVQNKAGYSMATNGRIYGADWTPTKTIQTKQGEKTTGGIQMHNSPIHAQPAKGQAETITQSALTDGAVSITDQAHQKQDISTLNRDTETSLHQLEKIFDKKKIQERRELVSEFAKLGAEKIGDVAKEKNWAEDDYRRTLLHGLLGALTAQMSGNSAFVGGAAGAATERLQPVLDKLLKDYPELREDAGSVIGYAVGKALNDGKTGEAVAWNGTKFNWLSHEQKEEKERLIAEAEERGDEKTVQSIRDYYDQLDQEQDAFIASANLSEDEEYSDETEHAIITGTKTLRDLRSKDNGHVVVVEALRLAKSRGLTNYNFGDEDFVSLNGSLGLDLGISGGFIMDRRGNVYYSTGTGMVFGASAGVTTGKFKADTSNWKSSDYKEAITGISGSFGFSGIFLSGAVSIGTQYGDREIGIASGAGLSASGIVNYTEFICNINDL